MAERVRVTGREPREEEPTAPATTAVAADAGELTVTTPSGSAQKVLTQEEAQWYEAHAAAYLRERTFAPSDLNELDQLMSAELQIMRFNAWVNQGHRWDGTPLPLRDISGLMRRVSDASEHARKLRDRLGISRAARMAEAQSPQAYLFNLRRRAREFGVMRQEQLIKAIDLWRELEAHVGAFDRSDAQERQVIGFVDEAAIVAWIRNKIPEFNEIDESFRKGQQKWVSTL